jgi:dTDP-4-dehydrorhamnose 3,5-epimerase
MINGVVIKELKTHGDQRGFFREVVRVSDNFFADPSNFGQWSHSRMQKNVVKAWHYHHVQTDWWYISYGEVETALYDNRPESSTYKEKMVFKMGDSNPVCVKIPPGVLHGCRVTSDDAHLFYITSHVYDPNEEGRIPYNAPEIDHDWGSEAIVADNDKRHFTPTSTRIPLR